MRILTLKRSLGSLMVLFATAAIWAALSGPLHGAPSSWTMQVGGGEIVVSLRGRLAVDRATLRAWIREAAQAVSQYYGRFPVRRLNLRLRAVGGGGIGGTAYGYDHHIDIPLGRWVDRGDLEDDWVLVHEMVHMGQPNMPARQKWFSEGMATYVEPIARAQTGDLPPERVWADLARQLPQGLPRAGDRGLDYTHTWARTYWGGALFCFLADIEIRERTDNRKGLQDALRGILAAGGTLDKRWSIDKTLAIGDKTVGVPVLTQLYNRMRNHPTPVDLDAIWRRLGVDTSVFGVKLVFDAPQAALRRAILENGKPRTASEH